MRPSQVTRLLSLLCLLAACDDSNPLVPDRRGIIRVSLMLGGLDLDPDGALVRVDGRVPAAVAAGGAVTFAADPGSHSVLLEGLADNCDVADGVSRVVPVSEGSQTEVVFAATCVAASGVVEVSITTQGPDPDTDGYLVTVDEGVAQRAMGGGMIRFAPVSPGMHSILLRDIAANCAVLGPNPITGIQVNGGGQVRDTVRATVTVGCSLRVGNLRLVTSTTGPGDPDGYVIRVGSAPGQTVRLAANDSLVLTGLPAQTLQLVISDIVGNCGVVGTVPGSVSIVEGETAVARFTLACVDPAVLRVIASTTGASLDPGYQVRVDGGGAIYALPAQDTLTLSLTPGSHTIKLEDIADNCIVGGTNPVGVNLSTAAPTELIFPVSCAALSRTGIDLTVSTTGSDRDQGYYLTLCAPSTDFDCFFPVLNHVYLPATSTLQVDLAPGSYYPILEDVADNCRATWTGAPNVVAGQVTSVRLDVTCLAPADFIVTATVTGSDLPEGFDLFLDGRSLGYLPAFEPTRYPSYEGDHTVELPGLQANCHSVSANPLRVSFVAGGLTPVGFEVACDPYPTVEIAVSSSGTNIPAGYLAVIDPDPIDGFDLFSSRITANGSVSTRVYPGSHQVWLFQVPSNCGVDGPNPVAVDAPAGGTIRVSFVVVCQ